MSGLPENVNIFIPICIYVWSFFCSTYNRGRNFRQIGTKHGTIILYYNILSRIENGNSTVKPVGVESYKQITSLPFLKILNWAIILF